MSSRTDAKVAQEHAEYEAYQLAVAEEARLKAEAEARQMAALNTAVGVFKQVVKTQLSVSVVGFRTNVAQAKRRAEETRLKAEVETRRKAEAEARRALEAAEKRIANEEACRAAAEEARLKAALLDEMEAASAALLDEMERRAEEAERCRMAAVQTAIIQSQQDKVAAAEEKRRAVTVKQTLSRWHVLMCIALVCVVMFMYSDNALTTSNVAPVDVAKKTPAAKTSEDSHVPDTRKADVVESKAKHEAEEKARLKAEEAKRVSDEQAAMAALLEKAKLKAEMDLIVEKGIEESKVHDAEELYLHLNAATSNLNVVNKQVKVYEDEITKEEAKFALVPRKESQIAVVNDNDRVAKNRKADKSTNERYMIEDEARHYPGGDTPEDEAKKAKAKKAEKEKKRLAEKAAKADAPAKPEAAAKKALDKLNKKAKFDVAAEAFTAMKKCTIGFVPTLYDAWMWPWGHTVRCMSGPVIAGGKFVKHTFA